MKIIQFAKKVKYLISRGNRGKQVYARIYSLKPSERLTGRKILITGGSRGLGLSMARQFIKEGASVIITGRNEAVLKQVSEEIGCHYLIMDINDISSFENIINQANKLIGDVDCLVNNAGISKHETSVFDVTPDGWDAQFNTNLKGPFFLTQLFIRSLLAKKIQGNVIFISSETGDTVDFRPYGFTKGAINNMAKGLAYLLKNEGIRVNVISPGVTATDMTGVGPDGNLYAGTYGQGRYYLPEEIAETACFLLSPVSDCISGQIITCNNAQTVNARWK